MFLRAPTTISKYILKECLVFFTLSLVIFTGLLLTVKILKLTSLVIHKGVLLSQVLKVILSIIPTFFEIAVPLAGLLGAMLAFARLSGDSEIVVMRATGISFYQILSAPIIIGVLLLVSNLYISNYLKPWGYKLFSNTLLEIAQSKSSSALEPGLFKKFGDLTLYCEDIDQQSGIARRVLIDDRREQNARKIILSQTGEINSNPLTRDITLLLKDGVIHEINGNKYTTTQFQSNSLVLESGSLFSSDTQKGRSAREMSAEELVKSQEELSVLLKEINKDNTKTFTDLSPLLQSQLYGQEINTFNVTRRINRNKIEKSLRLSIPGSCLLLTLIGAIFGIQPARMQKSWGISISICSAIIVFVFYYGVLSLGITLNESSGFNPQIATWLPNLFLLFVSGLLLYQLGKEKWNSSAEALAYLFQRIVRRVK